MLSESRAIPAAALMSVALAVLGCSSPDTGSDAGADTGGTGAGGSATSGSAGTGGSAGAGGGAGTGGVGASGGSAGGTGPTGGTPGTGGAAGTPSGGAGGSGTGGGGTSGSAGMAGNGMGGVAGASGGGAGGAGTGGIGGAGGSGGKAGGGSGGNAGGGSGGKAGAGGSGGAPNCTARTGGAIIDFRACNQTMRFWITNSAFITEAIRLRGNGQSRIACFPQPMDGRDCDPVLTYHANPSNPYWTDFELETYFTCPAEVESDKDFWLGQVGQFCGEMTSVTAVDDNR